MDVKSFKQMRNDGELIRADAEKIDYFSIHIEPGFNPEGRTDEEEAEDEELYQFIVQNGPLALPQLEVRPRPGGGVFIVDGHRRHKQLGRAIENGHFPKDKKSGLYPVSIRQFSGNDLKRLYRVKTSSKRKDLKPLQFAALCARARDGFGETVEAIAEGMQVSVSTIKDALTLADSNHDVQKMVAAGEVSKTIAAKVVRAKKESAGESLKDALQSARLQGKSKVTAKQVDGNTPADLVKAIKQEMESGGSFRAETLAPKFAPLIAYLRGTAAA